MQIKHLYFPFLLYILLFNINEVKILSLEDFWKKKKK